MFSRPYGTPIFHTFLYPGEVRKGGEPLLGYFRSSLRDWELTGLAGVGGDPYDAGVQGRLRRSTKNPARVPQGRLRVAQHGARFFQSCWVTSGE